MNRTPSKPSAPVAMAEANSSSQELCFGKFDGAGNFVLLLRPYYQDTDAGGVVYHTRYLEFAERARNELLRSFALPTTLIAEQEGVLFALRSLTAEWLKPAHLEVLLAVKTCPVALSGARLTFRQAFFAAPANLQADAQSNVKSGVELEESPLVILYPTLVCMDKDTGKAARIPSSVATALSKHWHDLPKQFTPPASR